MNKQETLDYLMIETGRIAAIEQVLKTLVDQNQLVGLVRNLSIPETPHSTERDRQLFEQGWNIGINNLCQ